MNEPRMTTDPDTGRALDAWVAEEVFGWPVTWATHDDGPDAFVNLSETTIDFLPHYSTDIAAAWEVVEKLAPEFHAVVKSPFHVGSDWFAGFTPVGVTGWNGRPDHEGSGSTAPLAICRAALKAVGARTTTGDEPSP